MSVRDIDQGYKRMVAALEKLADEPFVTVGIHEKEGAQRSRTFKPGGAGGGGTWVEDSDGATVAEYATYNEFGLGVPERSFMRSTVDEERREIEKRLADAIGKQIDGRQPMRRGLDRLGHYIVGRVKLKIRNLDTPANAPATIRNKGFDNPLVRTGRMRNSITHEVHGSEPAFGRLNALLRGD